MCRKDVEGTVYLIHFAKPYKGVSHYIGWTSNVVDRELRHLAGNGSKLLKAVTDAGIDFNVVRVWENKTRAFERSLKNQKNAYRFCPVCGAPPYKSKYLVGSTLA